MIKRPEDWINESDRVEFDAIDYMFIGMAIFIGLAGLFVGMMGMAQ